MTEKIKIPGTEGLLTNVDRTLTRALNTIAALRGQIKEMQAENERLTDMVTQLQDQVKSAYEQDAGESL